MYQIIDIQNGGKVGRPYTSRQSAARRADRLDLAYGAVRYIVKFIGV